MTADFCTRTQRGPRISRLSMMYCSSGHPPSHEGASQLTVTLFSVCSTICGCPGLDGTSVTTTITTSISATTTNALISSLLPTPVLPCSSPCDTCSSRVITGVNPVGDAGDTSLPIFWCGDVNGNIPTSTFGCSRQILVVLAQRQHLMVYFIHCFAQKCKICHRIDPNATEGAHDKEKL